MTPETQRRIVNIIGLLTRATWHGTAKFGPIQKDALNKSVKEFLDYQGEDREIVDQVLRALNGARGLNAERFRDLEERCGKPEPVTTGMTEVPGSRIREPGKGDS
jgi:hypothetical protein